MPRNKHEEQNKCYTARQQVNISFPIENSANAPAETGSEVSGGNPGKGNFDLVKESFKEFTLETEGLEKMRSPAIPPNRVNIDCDKVLPEPNASMHNSEDEVLKSEQKQAVQPVEAPEVNLLLPMIYKDLEESVDGSVEAYISQYQFESSIDEESLRSFLEISSPSPEGDEQSKNVSMSFYVSEGDDGDMRATLREIEGDEQQPHQTKSDFEKDNVLAVKCGEETSSEPSGSYHTARDSDIYEDVSENFMTSVERLIRQEESGEAQADHFETSIDEESLQSFLNISRSSPERSEDCTSCFSASEGDSHDKGKIPREIRYDKSQTHGQTGDSGKNSTATAKQKSDSTARTSANDQAARESRTHEELTNGAMNSTDEQLIQRNSEEAKATVESQIIIDNELISLTSESEATEQACRNSSGVPKKKQTSKNEVEEQKSGEVTASLPKITSVTKETKESTSRVKTVDRAQRSLAKALVNSHKNGRQLSQKGNRNTNTSKNTTKAKSQSNKSFSTKVKERNAGKISVRQRHSSSRKTGRSSGYLTEGQDRSRKTDARPKEKDIINTSTATVPRSETRLKRVDKERVRVSVDRESSLAKNVAKSEEKRAGNDRRSGSSRFRPMKSAGNTKEGQRGVQKPKRRSERNKLSIPRCKHHKNRKNPLPLEDGCHESSKNSLTVPIVIFEKDVLCFENALIQFQRDIIKQTNDVVSSIHYRVEKRISPGER